ncbi:MAG: ATP-binding cassette domain-containing protein [Clostridia bacterium]|nr:ATP-binding cassette domain-containing protein [Clostridia bacterium]
MLEVRNVKIEYYGEEITTLNFAFNKGVTLILGEVGSYKTTLFSVIGGIKEIPDGEIIIDGINIEEDHPRYRNIAYVGANSIPQGGKVLTQLALPVRLRGTKKTEAKKLAYATAEKFRLDPNKKIKSLCKAELVKFFAARLSMRKLQVTMFDEPYHFLGEENEHAITKLINSLGGYVLVSSCDGGDVKRLNPDYLVVVRRDKILADGKTEDVLKNASGEYLTKFLEL